MQRRGFRWARRPRESPSPSHGISIAPGGDVHANPLRTLALAQGAYFLATGQLKRWHGYVLLAIYVAYWIVSFIVYGGAPVDD